MNQPGVEDVGRGGERGCGGRERRDQALRGREHLAQGRHGVQQVNSGGACLALTFRPSVWFFIIPATDVDSNMCNYHGIKGAVPGSAPS